MTVQYRASYDSNSSVYITVQYTVTQLLSNFEIFVARGRRDLNLAAKTRSTAVDWGYHKLQM